VKECGKKFKEGMTFSSVDRAGMADLRNSAEHRGRGPIPILTGRREKTRHSCDTVSRQKKKS